MHPWCHCSIAPYEDSEEYEAWLDFLEQGGTTEEWKKYKKGDIPNFKHSLEGLGFKRYSNKEIRKIAKETADIAQRHVQMKSKWSGKIVITNVLDKIGKLWNCNILTTNKTSPHSILHEQLHAMSISLYPRKRAKEIFQKKRKIEEGAVQLCAQEISKKEGLHIDPSGYDSICDSLRKLNRILKIGSNDYDFSIQLIRVPVDERLAWLEHKRDARMQADKNISTKDLYEVNDIIDSMRI
ncbi:MAG: hypothetical protein Q4D99_02185 [Bacillota bacterium]|nr:hypothetical protein [Bacillota bacterium]